ncbi:MAG: selenium cofactor biosynthesis protein YqeC [Vicinamibacterales bacterium]
MELSSALAGALRLPAHPAIAFVGAGGKTTAMFNVARAMAPAIATTTTHLGDAQSVLADCHIVWEAGTPVADLRLLERGGVVLLTGGLDPDTGHLSGLSAPQWTALRRWCALHRRALLVEADGSRQRPLKAPAPHEPAIPDSVDAVVVVAGMLGCGLPLDADHVHRPDRFAAISGCRPGDPVTPEALAAALTHADGGLRNIPPGAGRAVLLNQADTPALQALAGLVGRRLRTAYDAVLVASLRGGRVELL